VPTRRAKTEHLYAVPSTNLYSSEYRANSESNEGCSECIEGKIRVKGTVQCIERWLIDYSKERARANLLNTKGGPGL
jgi:hypothetical protein